MTDNGSIEVTTNEDIALATWLSDYESSLIREVYERGFTLWYNHCPIGFGGINVLRWATDGQAMGECWFIAQQRPANLAWLIKKGYRRLLESMNLCRVQYLLEEGLDSRLPRFLGLKYEGTMKGFSREKKDVDVYGLKL